MKCICRINTQYHPRCPEAPGPQTSKIVVADTGTDRMWRSIRQLLLPTFCLAFTWEQVPKSKIFLNWNLMICNFVLVFLAEKFYLSGRNWCSGLLSGAPLWTYWLGFGETCKSEAPVRSEFPSLLRISEFFWFQWQNLANSESFQKVW